MPSSNVIPSAVAASEMNEKPRSGFSHSNRLFSSAINDATSGPRQHPSRMQVDQSTPHTSEYSSPSRRERTVRHQNSNGNARRYRSRSPISRDDSRRIRKPYVDDLSSRDRRRLEEEEAPRPSDRIVRKVTSGKVQVDFSDAREILSGRHQHRQRSFSSERHFDRPVVDMDGVIPPHDLMKMEREPLVKCAYFPNCSSGDACKFYHPTKVCQYFPNCGKGAECTYIHPVVPCKFQQMCQNPVCNYTHNAGAPQSSVVCKFFPNCVNANCQFVHPVETPCKFGDKCQKPGCHFTHPPGRTILPKAFINIPCRFGKSCGKVGCPYQHPPKDEQPTESQAMQVDSTQPPIGPQERTFEETSKIENVIVN